MHRPCKRGDRARVLEPDDLARKGQVRSVWSPIETDSRGIERRFEAGDEAAQRCRNHARGQTGDVRTGG